MLPVNNNTYFSSTPGSHSARETTPSGAISQATAAPSKQDEYRAIWSTWAENAPPGEGEERDVAEMKIRECMETKATELCLDSLNLTSLPNVFPEHIVKLNISGNKLTVLPDNLPQNLRFLNAKGNKLTALPNNLPNNLHTLIVEGNELTALPDKLPENLSSLSVSKNLLESLPEKLPGSLVNINSCKNKISGVLPILPSSLCYLNLEGNRITSLGNDLPETLTHLYLYNNSLNSLPDNLPVSLREIDVSANNLRTLPASILGLSSAARIDVNLNPFSERTLRDLNNVTQEVADSGPQIYFSMSEGWSAAPPALTESVKDWLSADSAGQWAAIEKEENAAAFSIFLSRLGETRNALENPEFRAQVTGWLNRLADTPALRETTFSVALGASASCEDRVTLAWNDMQKVALVYDVEHGAWDDKLPGLITTGCEMFRLDLLEQAARDKAKTLRFVDEIEVYLAYQTGLKNALELTSAGEFMRFGEVSGVTPEDLNLALVQVRDRESKEFVGWLAQWAPLKTVMQRTNPELLRNMQEQQAGILNDNYQRRVDAEMNAAGVAGIPDAEIVVGRAVWEEMNRENDIALTRAFLQKRYQTLMADKSPEQTLKAVTELASVATVSPVVAAMAIRPENGSKGHPGSQLAAIVAGGGMAPLAGAWISLLQLLYENKHLSAKEVTSALLPQKKQDRVKSLAHAIAGAAWRSEAATRLCALLSEVGDSDEKSRQEIIARLSLEQPGYGFRQLKLDLPADFYKRAKNADKFSRNDAAKTQLKEGRLIPQNRELYGMASGTRAGSTNRKPPTEALAQWIAVKGNWSGNFGDYAANLISRLYPEVSLNINVLNMQGNVTSRIVNCVDKKSANKVIELNLQNDHYSPVINGIPQKTSADGDCFFNSFLTALNGKTPSADDIQRLRNRLASYIQQNDEIADFIDIQTVPDIIKKTKSDIRRPEKPKSAFAILEEKIKKEITPLIRTSQVAMAKEKAELDHAKKSTRKRLDEINIREKEENERIFEEIVEGFAAHSATQALLHNNRRQLKSAAWERDRAEKRLRMQRQTPSWKGPVAMASASLFMPVAKSGEEAEGPLFMPVAKSGEEAAGPLKAAGTITDEQIRQRLDRLHSFMGDLETARLEERLKNLSSPGERAKSSRVLAPALRKD